VSSRYLRPCLKAIISRMRAETLNGVYILFSSVIPLDTRPESTDIWRMSHMFGARCLTELTGEITHVVAEKVRVSPPVVIFVGLMCDVSSVGQSRSTLHGGVVEFSSYVWRG
jgi:hypothetical protein